MTLSSAKEQSGVVAQLQCLTTHGKTFSVCVGKIYSSFSIPRENNELNKTKLGDFNSLIYESRKRFLRRLKRGDDVAMKCCPRLINICDEDCLFAMTRFVVRLFTS